MSRIEAEVLNISSGGLCLSINHGQSVDPREMEQLCVQHFSLENGPTIKNSPLKLCYFFRARDLKKIVCGLEFSRLEETQRRSIELFVQEQADRDEEIL
jgi:c-di-GMP-binding flagellar brake protein YcgR